MATILTRFEMSLSPDKRERYESAAKASGMSLSAWMQQAADEKLSRDQGLPEELLIEALEAVRIEALGRALKSPISPGTMRLVRAALESVGRL